MAGSGSLRSIQAENEGDNKNSKENHPPKARPSASCGCIFVSGVQPREENSKEVEDDFQQIAHKEKMPERKTNGKPDFRGSLLDLTRALGGQLAEEISDAGDGLMKSGGKFGKEEAAIRSRAIVRPTDEADLAAFILGQVVPEGETVDGEKRGRIPPGDAAQGKRKAVYLDVFNFAPRDEMADRLTADGDAAGLEGPTFAGAEAKDEWKNESHH